MERKRTHFSGKRCHNGSVEIDLSEEMEQTEERELEESQNMRREFLENKEKRDLHH